MSSKNSPRSPEVSSLSQSPRDSTAREAQESRVEILRSVIESLPEGIIVADLAGSYRIFNSAARQVLGVGPQDLHPTDWTCVDGDALLDGPLPDSVDLSPLGPALRGEEVHDREIFLRSSRAPGGRWIEASAGPWKDAAGTNHGAVILLRDIDERKAARELNKRLLTIVEQTSDAVLVTEEDGEIVYVNPSFERLTGFSRSEVIGQTPRILHSTRLDGGSYEEVWRGVLEGGSFRGSLVHRKKNGDVFRALHTITSVSDANGECRHLVSVSRDITDRLEDKRRRAQVDAGRAIQQRLYPKEAPRVPGFDIVGAAYPAESLCGDYYDFFPMAESGFGLTVADVCGHGIGPSILMAQARAYLRLLARGHADVGEILSQLNEILTVEGSHREFVTQILVRLDPEHRALVYANAGHPPGILVGSTGAVRRELRPSGMPLGLFAEQTFVSSPSIGLETGDVLVLFTDGLTECSGADGGDLGRSRVVELIQGHRHRPAAEILAVLGDAAARFRVGPQVDDMTIIVVKAE